MKMYLLILTQNLIIIIIIKVKNYIRENCNIKCANIIILLFIFVKHFFMIKKKLYS